MVPGGTRRFVGGWFLGIWRAWVNRMANVLIVYEIIRYCMHA